jgi:hypothetical protein
MGYAKRGRNVVQHDAYTSIDHHARLSVCFPRTLLDVQMYYPCTWSVACVIRGLVRDEMRTLSLLSVNDTTE